MEGGLIGAGAGVLVATIYSLRTVETLPDRPRGRDATGLVYGGTAWPAVSSATMIAILLTRGIVGPGAGWSYFVAAALFLATCVLGYVANRRVVDHFDGTYVVQRRHPVVLRLAPVAALVGGATVIAALVFERAAGILIGSVLGIPGVVLVELAARRAVRPRPTLEE